MFFYVLIFIVLLSVCAIALYAVVSNSINILRTRRVKPTLFVAGCIVFGIGGVLPLFTGLVVCLIETLTKSIADGILWLIYPFPIMIVFGGAGVILMVIFNHLSQDAPRKHYSSPNTLNK